MIDEVNETLVANTHILDPFREWMSDYFDKCSLAKTPTYLYDRRPPIGLKIDRGDFTVAIRPAWHAGSKMHGTQGELIPERMTIEIISREPREHGGRIHGVVMEVTLPIVYRDCGDICSCKQCPCDSDLARKYVNLVIQTAHELLTDPFAVFSQQADRCSCCHKVLTDAVSRTRGYGPECIKWVRFLKNAHKAREEYCKQYLEETGFLPVGTLS